MKKNLLTVISLCGALVACNGGGGSSNNSSGGSGNKNGDNLRLRRGNNSGKALTSGNTGNSNSSASADYDPRLDILVDIGVSNSTGTRSRRSRRNSSFH